MLNVNSNIIGRLLSGRGASDIDLENSVFVIIAAPTQSNEFRGTAQRAIQLTTEKEIPDGVLLYNKPSGATYGYSLADDGAFVAAQVGTIKDPVAGAGANCGSITFFADRLKRVSPNNVYVMSPGYGGSALRDGLTTPNWYEGNTGQLFDIALNYYYAPAYDDIVAANPGKTIYPIIYWNIGETDAQDATSRSQYLTLITNQITALRNGHSSLENALVIFVKLHYNDDANEAVINGIFDDYVAANPTLSKVIDISAYPRKIDLTTEQQGGISPYSTDDIHLSYLAQQAKADLAYAVAKSKYFPSAADSVYTVNDRFDPATLGTTGFRLQFVSSKMTIGAPVSGKSIISALTNDFSIGDFTTIVGSPRYKISGRHGGITTLVSSNGRINTSAAVGTSLFSNATGFSFNLWLKPRDGQGVNQYVMYDIQNTASANLSRFAFYVNTNGKLVTYAAISSVKAAQTANAIFNDGPNAQAKHVAVTYQNGVSIKMYVDGVLQTLDGTYNGDLTGFNLASYVNNTNPLTLFAQQTGASTFSNYFTGGLNTEICFHVGVVYSQSDVNNLMLNGN